MNPTRTGILVTAAALTVTAAHATIDDWTLAPFLRTLTIGAWITFTIATYAEQILTAITSLRDDITTYGDQRNADGIYDGMNHTTPAPPTALHRVR